MQKVYQRLKQQSWRKWGAYLSNRAWGTVRENYHPVGEAWEAFPFEHARSRAYRWTEDGIGGLSDNRQLLCMAVALWNERDPILKERFYGLSNQQGNHGEDIKDYFFYLDGLPDASYMKMLYKYPQVEFPYDRLLYESTSRNQEVPEYELIDALHHAFPQNRYFDVFIEYAKADTQDVLCRITAINRGNEPARLHVLPHLWYRNTWTWNDNSARPSLRADGKNRVKVSHPEPGEYFWYVDSADELLFTENETHMALLFDLPNTTPYVKDGIDYCVVRGQKDRVNPAQEGTKCAARTMVTLEPGQSFVMRTRLTPLNSDTPFADFESVFEQRQQEADEFYAALQEHLSQEEKFIQRTAFGGLNWNRNFYAFNVKRWLEGDANYEAPERKPYKSLEEWQHFDAHDVISFPDTWEYPWLALWDLAFQTVTICIIDPAFAKQQILLMLSERYMRADGAMAAFEGDFSTPHPPVFAWATWHVYHLSAQTEGEYDKAFLRQAYERLRLHFDWWMKNHCQEGYLFNGGFLGMDNISLIDRNQDIPEGGWLAQVDGTGWMAMFAINMLTMAVELGRDEEAADFLEHFVKLSRALASLWDEATDFFYDVLHHPDGSLIPLKVRSLVGLTPLAAVTALDPDELDKLPRLKKRLETLRRTQPDLMSEKGEDGCHLLAPLSRQHAEHLLRAIFDTEEFYSPYGLRSVSKRHENQPATCKIDGKTYELRYLPGEANSRMFGGNSNWRGPIWAPPEQLLAEALYYYHGYYGDKFTVALPELPSATLKDAALNLEKRLVSLFKRGDDGRRPFYGERDYFQTDPHWRDYLWFYEYFHGETGAGLGASHQNGWTALIAKMLHYPNGEVFAPSVNRGENGQ